MTELPSALAAGPLLIAAALALSAAMKITDTTSTQSVIRQLRLPRALASRSIAIALPIGELVVAAALLAPWRGVYLAAAIAATALFVTYLVVIAQALTFDPRPVCGCFGRMGNSDVSAFTLARNILFVIPAAAALAIGIASETVWSVLGASGSGSGGWWLLVIVVAIALTGLIVAPRPGSASGAGAESGVVAGFSGGAAAAVSADGRQALDHEVLGGHDSKDVGSEVDASEIEDPEDYLRSAIPAATLQRDDGTMVTLREMATQRAQLLVMVNCTCWSTVQTSERLAAWRGRLPQLDVRLVTTLAPASVRRVIDADELYYDHASLVWHALQVTSSPGAVLLGADGQLAGGPVGGVDEVEEFVTDIAESLAEFAEA